MVIITNYYPSYGEGFEALLLYEAKLIAFVVSLTVAFTLVHFARNMCAETMDASGAETI